MAGTLEGGRKAAAKNLARDPDFYKNIGRRGGQNGTTGGFAAMDKDRLRIVSRKGGTISRRKKRVPIDQMPQNSDGTQTLERQS